jgi:hypothetical protein
MSGVDRAAARPTISRQESTLPYLLMSLYPVTRQRSPFYAVTLMFGLACSSVILLDAILVCEYIGAWIMGTTCGAVGFASTLDLALGPLA